MRSTVTHWRWRIAFPHIWAWIASSGASGVDSNWGDLLLLRRVLVRLQNPADLLRQFVLVVAGQRDVFLLQLVFQMLEWPAGDGTNQVERPDLRGDGFCYVLAELLLGPVDNQGRLSGTVY